MPNWKHGPISQADSGWGWTSILILLICSVGYAGGGVVYNHKRKGMALDQNALPHRDMWLGVVGAFRMMHCYTSPYLLRGGRLAWVYPPLCYECSSCCRRLCVFAPEAARPRA